MKKPPRRRDEGLGTSEASGEAAKQGKQQADTTATATTPQASEDVLADVFGGVFAEIFGATKHSEPPRHRKGRGKAQKNIDLIQAAYQILEEIQPATVRAVCYRLFVAGLIPSMDKKNTNRVGIQLVSAREDGTIPWEWIVDEGRRAESVATWANPEEILDSCVRNYRRDYWNDQEEWVEVWSEKGTVRGTLAPILDKYGITFRVMHGYGSATVLHDVAEMAAAASKLLTVLYVGDWDPSGMHMSELDIPSRLERYGDGTITIVRVALAECDTTSETEIPGFPASDKQGDRRYRWFTQNYGHRCWELDALPPPILRSRVEGEILERLDQEAWDHATEVEAAEVASMREFLVGYPIKPVPASEYSTGPDWLGEFIAAYPSKHVPASEYPLAPGWLDEATP